MGALGVQSEKQGADQAVRHGRAMPARTAGVESLLQRGNSKEGTAFLNKIPWIRPVLVRPMSDPSNKISPIRT
ncbi:hypothetical protein GCM10019071_00590 [Sphingobium fuliginis]|uniref:Uncharacterized protein n=1 Tax=Sphingobium fuliginis (strain ATCC 27551) TaxID=336203 RepID=A0ABQ1ELB7_SPHSA|nr:hypothetical protein GCM10019071_00590 [Sphingobium fuliginis]